MSCELADRAGREPVAAGLLAREALLLDDEHAVPGLGEPVARRRARGTAADDERVPRHAVPHACALVIDGAGFTRASSHVEHPVRTQRWPTTPRWAPPSDSVIGNRLRLDPPLCFAEDHGPDAQPDPGLVAMDAACWPADLASVLLLILLGITVRVDAPAEARPARHLGRVHRRRGRRVRDDDARLRDHPARVDHVRRQVPAVGHDQVSSCRSSQKIVVLPWNWPFDIDMHRRSATSSPPGSTSCSSGSTSALFVAVAEARAGEARGRSGEAAHVALRSSAAAPRQRAGDGRREGEGGDA